MTSRSRLNKKPPPALVPQVTRLSPRQQKLLAFVCDGRVAWLLALAVFFLLGLAQPLIGSQTFTGEELSGTISSGRWSLTLETPSNTGETTFFSDVSGFMPVSQNELVGELHRIKRLSSAYWSWEEEGTYIWSGNASTTWQVSALTSVTVVVEYDNNGAFAFYILSVVCLVFWVMRLVSLGFEKLLARLNKRSNRQPVL